MINTHKSTTIIIFIDISPKESYLSLSNVSDSGAGGDPFEDPKDSDILAKAARYDKEKEDEEEELEATAMGRHAPLRAPPPAFHP